MYTYIYIYINVLESNDFGDATGAPRVRQIAHPAGCPRRRQVTWHHARHRPAGGPEPAQAEEPEDGVAYVGLEHAHADRDGAHQVWEDESAEVNPRRTLLEDL